MTTLRMIRAEINLEKLMLWMGAQKVQDQNLAMHQLITGVFGDLAPQPFHLVTPRHHQHGQLYAYTYHDADQLRDALICYADPLQAHILPADSLLDKAMPDHWREGQRLGFQIRIAPTRRHRQENGKSIERDVYQSSDRHLERGAVYAKWLAERLERQGAARLENSRLHSFHSIQANRKSGRPAFRLPEAVMRGALTITDGAEFTRLLAHGIGRHKAYGYGMLMLQPDTVRAKASERA